MSTGFWRCCQADGRTRGSRRRGDRPPSAAAPRRRRPTHPPPPPPGRGPGCGDGCGAWHRSGGGVGGAFAAGCMRGVAAGWAGRQARLVAVLGRLPLSRQRGHGGGANAFGGRGRARCDRSSAAGTRRGIREATALGRGIWRRRAAGQADLRGEDLLSVSNIVPVEGVRRRCGADAWRRVGRRDCGIWASKVPFRPAAARERSKGVPAAVRWPGRGVRSERTCPPPCLRAGAGRAGRAGLIRPSAAVACCPTAGAPGARRSPA